MAAARQALRRVHNPVGKLMAVQTDTTNAVRRAFHIGLLRNDVAQVMLAMRLYMDQHSEPPKLLNDLVDGGLLPKVPVDPFSAKPLSYSPAKGIVWSFGVDEKDDGGHWDFDAEWPDGKDLVWKVPRR
jgi:hypothetical protein